MQETLTFEISYEGCHIRKGGLTMATVSLSTNSNRWKVEYKGRNYGEFIHYTHALGHATALVIGAKTT